MEYIAIFFHEENETIVVHYKALEWFIENFGDYKITLYQPAIA